MTSDDFRSAASTVDTSVMPEGDWDGSEEPVDDRGGRSATSSTDDMTPNVLEWTDPSGRRYRQVAYPAKIR